MSNKNTLIRSKLPNTGTTIFTTMSAMALEYGAVNLGQGFPDFDCDPRLLSMMNEALHAGHNQYAPMAGVMPLREAVAQQLESLYARHYDPVSEITITAGATQAIHTAISVVVHPGDEVILFEPVYDSYEPAVRLNGGIPVYSRLRAPSYRPDWNEVRALITPRTRAMVINTPHNPTASIWTRDDMDSLATLLRDTNIVVISDEVYEHIVYDGAQHHSVSRHPQLAERSFMISSFGKSFHVTGWKIAYCAAPAALMNEFRKAHQFVVFCVHAPSQYALAEYMKLDRHGELKHFYQNKRDLFLNAVKDCGLQWFSSQGTYFVSASYADVPGLTSMSDRQVAIWMTQNIGVACIPLSSFYHDQLDEKIIRFCFSKQDSTLIKAAEKLSLLKSKAGA
jgi:methionine aminotransferase